MIWLVAFSAVRRKAELSSGDVRNEKSRCEPPATIGQALTMANGELWGSSESLNSDDVDLWTW